MTGSPSPFEVERTPEMIAGHRVNVISNAVNNLIAFESNETSDQTLGQETLYTPTPPVVETPTVDNATVAGQVVVTAEQHYDSQSIEALRQAVSQNSTTASTQRQTFVDSEGRIG